MMIRIFAISGSRREFNNLTRCYRARNEASGEIILRVQFRKDQPGFSKLVSHATGCETKLPGAKRSCSYRVRNEAQASGEIIRGMQFRKGQPYFSKFEPARSGGGGPAGSGGIRKIRRSQQDQAGHVVRGGSGRKVGLKKSNVAGEPSPASFFFCGWMVARESHSTKSPKVLNFRIY